MRPRVLVLRSPGTNCDAETAWAFEQAGAEADTVHINQLIASPADMTNYQILCFPGGFSYGDDVGAGRILASRVGHFLFEQINQFREDGKLVLGICNGFQVLIKTGLLVPRDEAGFPVTLTWNDNGRYTARWVTLRRGDTNCLFLSGVEAMYLPIAHAEGRFVTRDDTTLDGLNAGGNVALRYAPACEKTESASEDHNPNGSDDDIAGICDASGQVFGLMPHPERYIDPTHHPRWTRIGLDRIPDGRAIFENAVSHFA